MDVRRTLLSFILISSLVAGCGKKNSRSGEAQPTGAGRTVADVINVVRRPDKAPNFSWKESTGKIVDLETYGGKVTFINFWATWCGPCKKELPDLADLSRELADRNVKFIGVATDRGPNIIEDVRTFVSEHAIPYPVVISTDDLEDAFGNPRLIPTSYLVDANGKIAQTFVGMQSKGVLTRAISSLLK